MSKPENYSRVYTLNEARKDYVYSMFMYNRYMVLDWDRQRGKSNYSVTCILDYAINHPGSNNLIIGYNKESSESLGVKLIKCNFDRLQPILVKHSKLRMDFTNGSVIYFNDIKDINYDTILLDEIESFNIRYHGPVYFFNRLSEVMSPNTMILSNCTGYSDNKDSVKMFNELLQKHNMQITINRFMNDEEISCILRRKKIEKIKTIILE